MKKILIDIRNNELSIGNNWMSFEDIGINNLYSDQEIRDHLQKTIGEHDTKYVNLPSNVSGTRAEIANRLLKLKEIAETGYIVHDIETGEEWLCVPDEDYIFLGTGNTSDWTDSNGAALEGIQKVVMDLPDDVGTQTEKVVYKQKNTDVLNPVNEFAGWMKDFELVDDGTSIYSRKIF